MKQRYAILLTVCYLLLTTHFTHAQQFRWLTGGGSTDNMVNGGAYGEWITNMCTDDNGNVYSLAVVGDYNIKADTFFLSQSFNATVSPFWNILFMSHDCNGNMRFAKLIESYSNNFSNGLTYHAGKVYVAGTLFNTGKRIGYDATFNTKFQTCFLSKFDTSGGYEWTQFVGPDIVSTQVGSGAIHAGLDVDGQGNIHYIKSMGNGVQITPSITSQQGNYDLKYDPNGNLLSVTKLQSIDSNYWIRKVEIDKATNRYYALFVYAGVTTTHSGTVLAGYHANGTQLWKDTTNPRASISSFRFIPNDGIYFSAFAYVQYGGLQIGSSSINGSAFPIGPIAILGKINASNGLINWMYQMGCSHSTFGLTDLEILPDKSIMAIGNIGGGVVVYNHVYKDTIVIAPAEGHNPFIVNIDSTGLLIDWHQLNGSGFYDNGRAITSDKAGNVYFGGESGMDMQAGSMPKYTSNGGNSDYYLGKYGFDCNCTSMANPTSAFTYSITDSSKKEVQFTFTGTTPNDSVVWRFGDGSVLTQANPTHIFADTGVYTVCAKVMVPCGRKVVCQDIYVPHKDTTNNIIMVNAFAGVKIYPNPANDVLYIDGLKSGSRIELYDIVGRKAHMIITASKNEAINISYLSPGNYIIHITNPDGQRMQGKVVKR